MSLQPKHTGSKDAPRLPIDDIDGSAAWCFFSCTTESLQCAAGEVIVLRVMGEVDQCTIPILHTALDESLGQHPAHLLVDLARMTFCSAQGLDLLTQSRRSAASKATGYAVTGVPSQINRVWTLCWDGDLPISYHSTAAALTAFRATEPDVQLNRPGRTAGNTFRPEDFQLGSNVFPLTHLDSSP
jgi:anti-anti-sigma factor